VSTSSSQTGIGDGVVHGWPILPDGYVLGQVSGVAVDSHDHVFIFHRADSPSFSADQPHHVILPPTVLCFEGATGKLLASWGANQFVVPHGLRVDREDNVWLTDVELHQVFKFSHDGKLLMTLGTKGEPGQDGGHFNRPTDIAIAPDGTIYVSDGYGNSRVAKFSGNGKFLGEWGHKGSGPGEFNILMASRSTLRNASMSRTVRMREFRSFSQTGNFSRNGGVSIWVVLGQ
jgi:peptidylamidoglycolate lyase